MTCPFLKEAQVKYCRTTAVRKLIPPAQPGASREKCSSSEFASCRVYQSQPADEEANGGACPYLCESLMQYCAAAPVAKLVPYSEALVSRCGNDSFRYCELYLALAHPRRATVEGMVEMPEWLRYSANHMWVDVTEDGTCHIGVDAFLARALGTVERLTYIWQKGIHRPAAVLTVGGIDLEIVFPNSLMLTNCNLYLRANPSRIASEPYTAGWMFEGTPLPETALGLTSGAEAREWMEREQRRMNEFLQPEETPADGGMFAPGVVRQLDRERALVLFHEFFL